jgi:zeaxanthin glucosyltransferase
MKIGFVSLPVVGHLNPMTTLARSLQSRGHEIFFIGVPDVEPFARAAGLKFVPFCENEYPAGSVAKLLAPVSKLHGLEVTHWTVRETSGDLFRAASKYLPQKLAETHVEALVIDTLHAFLELVPMSLGMPYAHVWNVLHIDLTGATPPCFFSWPHESTPQAVARNLEGVKVASEIFAPVVPFAVSYAEKMGLQINWNDFTATTSKLAVITQTPKEFDYPGIPWPAQFHYAGPFYDSEGRKQIPFPWEKLNGSPLVYASMGTLVNGLEHVYKTILNATAQFSEIQVVLSVGENVKHDDLGTIPSNVIVVRTAPQIELLKRAALCITHAGLNTALESLGQGVPMVAIPVGYDQPGVAARIAHHGVGEFLEIEDLAVERLRHLIEGVLDNPRYRDKARWFQKVITQTRGLDVAADVIERAFKSNHRQGVNSSLHFYDAKQNGNQDGFSSRSGSLLSGR